MRFPHSGRDQSVEKGLTMTQDADESGRIRGYAYREFRSGEIDLDTISDTPESVRVKYLQMCMGWRFEHPDRYNQSDEWARLLTYGEVVPVRVSVVAA